MIITTEPPIANKSRVLYLRAPENKHFLISTESFICFSPSAPARPAGGRAHKLHDRSLRRLNALFDAIARTADQRQREHHDRQDAYQLISQTGGHRSAIYGRRQGKTREKSPAGGVRIPSASANRRCDVPSATSDHPSATSNPTTMTATHVAMRRTIAACAALAAFGARFRFCCGARASCWHKAAFQPCPSCVCLWGHT